MVVAPLASAESVFSPYASNTRNFSGEQTMMQIRHASKRGRTAIGWLDSYHSFSFGDYYDPENMGYRSLRVLNDDIVAPGRGFGMHPHRDMEIVTYVLSGAIEHKDSLGT